MSSHGADAILFPTCAALHGTKRASEARPTRNSPIGEEGQRLISMSLESYTRLMDANVRGITTSAIVAALPEVSVVVSLVDPGKPFPGLLQLQLTDTVRVAMEARTSHREFGSGHQSRLISR